jgi:hypothetical protein
MLFRPLRAKDWNVQTAGPEAEGTKKRSKTLLNLAPFMADPFGQYDHGGASGQSG